MESSDAERVRALETELRKLVGSPAGLRIESHGAERTLTVEDADRGCSLVVGPVISLDDRIAVTVTRAAGQAPNRPLGRVSDFTWVAVGDHPRKVAAWILWAVNALMDAVDQELQNQRAVRAAARLKAEQEHQEWVARLDAREVAARERAQVELTRAANAAKAELQQRRTELAERQRLRDAASKRYQALLQADFLAADRVASAENHGGVLGAKDRSRLRRDFVQEWAARTLDDTLDGNQAAAVAAAGGHVKVVARAGSGKTRTLVAAAAFLQNHCHVAPEALLLLAFNRAAAVEMRQRLANVSGPVIPHVMTFHALAHAIVHPDENLVFDDHRFDQLGMSREVHDAIDELVRSENGDRIRAVMLAHFRSDWEQFSRLGLDLGIEESLKHRRSLRGESIKGDFVKSYGEKVIANTLFEHGVDYQYEAVHRWDGSSYRPDFTIYTGTNSGLAIEYFGLVGDPTYDRQIEEKRRYWARRPNWSLLEYSPAELGAATGRSLSDRLLADITKAGVPLRRRTEDEIWRDIKVRAVGRFSQVVASFVARARKRNLDAESLETLIRSHVATPGAESLFLDAATSVYAQYGHQLEDLHLEDFDGLLWRAISRVSSGDTTFIRDRGQERGDLARLGFILIDEFQDFSEPFAQLIGAVQRANPEVRLFCVGDDWQAINGFAGSDLKYFEAFSKTYKGASTLRLSANYRSSPAVVEVGNAVMAGRGPIGRSVLEEAGSVQVARLDAFVPTGIEFGRHGDDFLTPAILRVVRSHLDLGLDVVLLARRNSWPAGVRRPRIDRPNLDDYVAHVRAFLPEEVRGRVTASTAHKYKGLEQDAVVIIDASDGSYPLIHPNWIFLRVFGVSPENIEEEERRLFYVALTRARKALTIVTEHERMSPFLRDILVSRPIEPVEWRTLEPVASLDGARLEIRVRGYEVREALKSLGYNFMSMDRSWSTSVPAEGFEMEALLAQPWARLPCEISIHDETGAVVQTYSSWGPIGDKDVAADA